VTSVGAENVPPSGRLLMAAEPSSHDGRSTAQVKDRGGPRIPQGHRGWRPPPLVAPRRGPGPGTPCLIGAGPEARFGLPPRSGAMLTGCAACYVFTGVDG
jgi:hypothetical protein